MGILAHLNAIELHACQLTPVLYLSLDASFPGGR